MFRKEYKQANDNIKVDEALLERTLEAAFADKPKKKTYYYRSFAPVAAALVIVVGASAAYPKLVKEPEIEKTMSETVTATLSPTMNPDAQLQFEAVPEKKVVPETTAPKPVVVIKPEATPVQDKTTEDVAVVSENTEPTQETEEMTAVAETENPISDFAQIPSVARLMPEAEPAYSEPEQESGGFVQISCKFKDTDAEYIYENEEGKSFSVTVTETHMESVTGFSVFRDGKVYIFSSDNMTEAEIMEVFETLNI